jgi:hypothetical protein
MLVPLVITLFGPLAICSDFLQGEQQPEFLVNATVDDIDLGQQRALLGVWRQTLFDHHRCEFGMFPQIEPVLRRQIRDFPRHKEELGS